VSREDLVLREVGVGPDAVLEHFSELEIGVEVLEGGDMGVGEEKVADGAVGDLVREDAERGLAVGRAEVVEGGLRPDARGRARLVADGPVGDALDGGEAFSVELDEAVAALVVVAPPVGA
jgi:hypothetical protein